MYLVYLKRLKGNKRKMRRKITYVSFRWLLDCAAML
jgi:hypothetical protein